MIELLVGSDRFWTRASRDIAAAKRRVLIQTLSLEGDSAGLPVADAMLASDATDRRILVDDYIRHVINDSFLALPQARWNQPLMAEKKATRVMIDGLVAAAVGVRLTNPIGWNVARYGIRNHKKLLVADDAAYIGGINYSEHNFAWPDVMLRIADPGAADFLAADFSGTWGGTICPGIWRGDGLSLYALDGRDNAATLADLFTAIDGAQERIELISPYPTFPFVQALGAAAKRGVSVEIFTPLPNNKPIVRAYLAHRAPKLGLKLHLLPEMIHMKGILIDGRRLIIGSFNFDFAGYNSQEEYVAICDDDALAAIFEREVLAPARAKIVPAHGRSPLWHLAWSFAILGLGDFFTRLMSGTERSAVDWML